MNLWDEIYKLKNSGQNAVLCTVVQTSGSTPRKPGAKMLVFQDKSIKGSIGGGNLEQKCIEQALIQLEEQIATTYKYNLLKDLEMCCGGSVAVYFEPIMQTNNLHIFGAGHTGQALSKIAADMNFEVHLYDDRQDYLDQSKNSQIKKKLINFESDLQSIKTTPTSYVVIMTYSHAADRLILSHFVEKELAYLGMIGSQRKVIVTKKKLKEEQRATVKEIDRIDMPMGININAKTPEEIAVSIMAKLISIKNG